MSGSLHTWYSLPDLDMLAERAAVLEGEIPLKQMARLSDLLRANSGSVRASLRFRQRLGGWLILRLEYEATLQLTCQRCLEPLVHHVNANVELGLLESDAVQSYSPEGVEPFVVEGGRFNPAVLIEDELIVALPLVPRHERRSECGPIADRVGDASNNEPEGDARPSAPSTSH
jgi:DUF177 domain-containing protein